MSMPPYGVKPGRRRAGPHRCPSVWHALGWTVLSAVVPGSGFLHNRRQRLGALVFLVSLVGVVWVGLEAPHNLRAALDLAFSPSRLTRAAIETAVCLVLWVAVVVGTFVVLRPRPAEPRWHLMGGSALVGRPLPGRRRAGRARRPRRVRAGPRREQGLHPQPDGHPPPA